MELETLVRKTYPAETEVNETKETSESSCKRGSKMLYCLLGIAMLFVLNTIYNFTVVAKGTPILRTIIKNPFFNFPKSDKEKALLRQEAMKSVGVVTGILYSEDSPIASVGIKLVRQGDVISSAKVIKIYKDRVEFEKDGFSWTQNVMEKPVIEKPK
jgi:hypothetical protein